MVFPVELVISDEFIMDCQVLAHPFENNVELLVACDVLGAICNSFHKLRQPNIRCNIADNCLAHYQDQLIFNSMVYTLVSWSEALPVRYIRFGMHIQQQHEVTIVGFISLEYHALGGRINNAVNYCTTLRAILLFCYC